MPPLYDFECKECKKQISILRSIKDSEEPHPTREDENDSMQESDSSCAAHQWVRVYLSAPLWTRGPNFTGRKGYW